MLSDSQIADMVGTLPDACLKHADSGKYIAVGDTLAARYKASSSSQMIGLTVADMGFVQTELGRRHAEQTAKMDAWVCHHGVPANVTRATLLHDTDKLVYETVKKIPVLSKRKVSGILTFALDLSAGLPHETLYTLYKNIFGSRRLAVEKTLTHLDLNPWFFAAPTEVEWLVLVARSEGKSNQQIATERQVSVRTIETHINRLRSKLRGEVLPQVIQELRRHFRLAVNASDCEPVGEP